MSLGIPGLGRLRRSCSAAWTRGSQAAPPRRPGGVRPAVVAATDHAAGSDRGGPGSFPEWLDGLDPSQGIDAAARKLAEEGVWAALAERSAPRPPVRKKAWHGAGRRRCPSRRSDMPGRLSLRGGPSVSQPGGRRDALIGGRCYVQIRESGGLPLAHKSGLESLGHVRAASDCVVSDWEGRMRAVPALFAEKHSHRGRLSARWTI